MTDIDQERNREREAASCGGRPLGQTHENKSNTCTVYTHLQETLTHQVLSVKQKSRFDAQLVTAVHASE